MEQWLSKDTLLWVSGAVSLVGAVGMPWIMVKMPADAFLKMERQNWLDKKPAALRVPPSDSQKSARAGPYHARRHDVCNSRTGHISHRDRRPSGGLSGEAQAPAVAPLPAEGHEQYELAATKV